ncbi:DUF2975 domain-containing protein [Photobacterium alginatilyticum]|uniref:DUF2975 domain-containing protein n=1 Tax=Photobacterium alginatilyticum TaxID=1775171 RepID=UPI004067854C
MSVQNAIQTLSQRLLILLWIILLFTPLSITFIWFYGTLVDSAGGVSLEFSYDVSLPLTVGKSLMGYPFALLPSLVYMAIIWQLICLFRLYQLGDVFTQANVSCFRRIANLMIATPVISVLSNMMLGAVLSIGQESFNIGFTIDDSDLTILLIGLTVRAISHVMTLAKDIKEENELTV